MPLFARPTDLCRPASFRREDERADARGPFLAARLTFALFAICLLVLGPAGPAAAGGWAGTPAGHIADVAEPFAAVTRAATCSPQLLKLGLCPSRSSKPAPPPKPTVSKPSFKKPVKPGRLFPPRKPEKPPVTHKPPGNSVGSRPLRRPGNGKADANAGKRVVCINGVRIGSSCGCSKGGSLRRINASTFKCTSGTAAPCPDGRRRVGKACIPIKPPTGGAQSNSTGTGTPGSGVICIGGKSSGSHCHCPKGTSLRRIGRNRYNCVVQPCGKGRCGDTGRPGGQPPPHTHPGNDSGHGGTSVTDRCIGGRMQRGACHCEPPYRAARIAPRKWRCVLPPCLNGKRRIGLFCMPPRLPDPPTIIPCPPDTHRSGRRCIPDARPDPRPHCRAGWRLRNGRCVRILSTACPDGTARSAGRCIRIPSPPRFAGTPPVITRPAPRVAAATDDSPYEPDEVLVEITGASPQQVAARLIRIHRLTTLSQTRLTALGSSLYRFRIPPGQTVEAVVAALAREPDVDTSQPNWRYRLNAGPSALPRSSGDARSPAAPAANRATLPQYARDLIGAATANTLSRGTDILVAVIDTGLDENHPELKGAIAGRYNAFPSQPFEPDTHATAIASIIAARHELAGIAPDARILTVQAFTPTSEGSTGGAGTSHRIITGINWALMKGARILNMSFAGPRMDDIVGKFISRYTEAGVVFIAAAGNGGPDAPPAYPAAHPAVIAVTAIDERKGLYAHANVGSYIDLAAPGVEVMAAAKDGAYDLASGTSFAAAHVAGVVALMLARSPRLSRERALASLVATAIDLGPPGPDERFGAGCINAHAALLGMSLETSGSAP